MAATTGMTQTVNYIFLALFCLLFTFRYLRTFVSIFTWTFWKAVPIAVKPKYNSKDVTVLIPTTFKTPHELMSCIKRVLACNPAKVFVITSSKNVELVKDMCILNNYGQQDVVVLGVDKLNKREQLLRALPSVETPITVLADDDVFWPSSEYLDYLLAIFENDRVGGGGTRQRVVRLDRPDWINMLGISYLERRVWNNCASNAVDGSISTLSGRTAAYRTRILQNDDFYFYFRNDSWRGRPLHSDDDKCLTRYVYSNGWEIKIQPDSRAVLETIVEPDFAGYQQQCLRWARAHFRGNFTVMENETYWRSRKMWWGLYVIYISQWQTPNFLVEGVLYGMLFGAVGGPSVSPYFWLALVCFFLLSKNLKMMPHFCRHPADLKFIPALMLFSYYHGCLNIWALCTMTTTHWGNKQLSEDAQTRARPEEITELIKNAKDFVDGYHEPTPGHILDGPDYFLARPQAEDKAIEHLFDNFADTAQGAEIESTDSDAMVGDMGEVNLIDQCPAVPFDLLA
ncbi:putative nucleotide-diphospho-sugar transferase [Septoria linicola]|nr:putative nucleotide-diphospho-sugar transferase [Septoria linicola]